jgi:hypothetical protein
MGDASGGDIELSPDDMDALADTVTRAFRSPADAERLLRRIGYPSGLTPSFAVDHRYAWNQVFQNLANGVVPSPYRRLLTEALKVFPANPVFSRLGRLPDLSRVAVRHVLVVGASPGDAERVRGDREVREIRDAADRHGALMVTPLPAAAATDLREVRTLRPDVLHLACHGDGVDLVFETPEGDSAPVAASRIVGLLAAYRQHDDVRLGAVVLNSCHSAEIAKAFAPVADVVVGHRGELDDECAVAFSGELYRALRDARSFAAAARVAAATAALSSGYCTGLDRDLVVLPPDG